MSEKSREDEMVVLERDADGNPTVWCDPEIADLVSALNKAGIRTVASCSGHGHRPGNIMLADGSELVIARDFDEARKIDAMFPGINGEPPAVQGEQWLPMETAPRDGTMVRLLVDFTENEIDDGEGPFPTIGHNTLGDTGEELWQIAGWCWSHDHYTEGAGTPVGWLPMLAPQPAEQQPSTDALTPVPDELFAAEFKAWWERHGQFCRAGGGDYERTFAFEAWRHLYPRLMSLQKLVAEQQPALTKYQPCGCVLCTCEHETQCQGCGAKHCGTHPVGQFSEPSYQQPAPDVAGLVEALEGIMRVEARGRVMPVGAEWDAARSTLAAHRRQGGEV